MADFVLVVFLFQTIFKEEYLIPRNETSLYNKEKVDFAKIPPLFMGSADYIWENFDENCYEFTIQNKLFRVQAGLGCSVSYGSFGFQIYLTTRNGYITYISKSFRLHFSEIVMFVPSNQPTIVLLFGSFTKTSILTNEISETVEFSSDVMSLSPQAESKVDQVLRIVGNFNSTKIFDFFSLGILNNTNCYMHNNKSCLSKNTVNPLFISDLIILITLSLMLFISFAISVKWIITFLCESVHK